MGASPTKVDGPHMCFNSAKSWQLGWYDDTNLVLNAEEINDNLYQLVSIAEYNIITATDDYVIIKMTKCADRFEYYINFNRKTIMTADSSEGENNLLVTRMPSSSNYQDSQLIARLEKNEEYVTKALKGGKLIAIQFKSLSLESSPASASVKISKYLKCRSDFNCNDYDACTTSKCTDYDRYGDGICSFSEVSCDKCGTQIMMNSTTNEFADYFSWEINDAGSSRIIMSSEPTLSPHTAYSASKCLPFGDYSLVARYSKIQTISENVSYSLQAADLLIYEASTNAYLESEELFTVCASDSDCQDYDGCTTDVCDSETRLCESQLLNDTDCSNCTWVTLELTLDNYPDETSWNLATEVGKHDVDVLSGK